MKNTNSRGRRRAGGFTIVELLAVVLIIMVMTAMLFPTIASVRTKILVNNTKTLLAIIEGGIEQYYADLKTYPVNNNKLMDGLTGWQAASADGQDGFGWRKKGPDNVYRGRVYGPYGGTQQLKMNSASNVYSFVDTFDRTIMYYPYSAKDNVFVKATANDGGPTDINAYATGPSGFLRKDYILISRGPDGVWGALYTGGAWTTSDDITNMIVE